MGLVSTHKRQAPSVTFQLSKDLQRASGSAQRSAQRRLQPHCPELAPRNARPPAAEMLPRALLLCAALALGRAGGSLALPASFSL